MSDRRKITEEIKDRVRQRAKELCEYCHAIERRNSFCCLLALSQAEVLPVPCCLLHTVNFSIVQLLIYPTKIAFL